MTRRTWVATYVRSWLRRRVWYPTRKAVESFLKTFSGTQTHVGLKLYHNQKRINRTQLSNFGLFRFSSFNDYLVETSNGAKL